MSDQSQHTQPFFVPSSLLITFGDSPSNAKPNAKRTAYLIIDGTAQKKQGKKMENIIIYKWA